MSCQRRDLPSSGNGPKSLFHTHEKVPRLPASCLPLSTAAASKVYLDTKDILPDEPGQERLAEPICSADTVVFIISPDAIASKVCAWEAEESQRAGKRILPVVWQRTGHGVPPGPATAQLHQSGIALVDPMRPKATRIGCDGAITRAPVQGHVIDCPPHCI